MIGDKERAYAQGRRDMLAEVIAFVLTLNDLYRWNAWIADKLRAKFGADL